MWTNHEKLLFCPKFPLTHLKMLLEGQNVPKLVDIMHLHMSLLIGLQLLAKMYNFRKMGVT